MLFLETCACLQCNRYSRIDARQQYIDKRMAIAKRTTITSVHTFVSPYRSTVGMHLTTIMPLLLFDINRVLSCIHILFFN
jgi:hypothetical protein